MKAYIEQLLKDIADPIAGRNLLREYLQARILEILRRAGAMVPLAFHGGTPSPSRAQKNPMNLSSAPGNIKLSSREFL